MTSLYIFAHNSKLILPQRASLAGVGSHIWYRELYSASQWINLNVHSSKKCLFFQQKNTHKRWVTLNGILVLPQIYKGDPRPRISLSEMVSSALGSNWGTLSFCQPHTWKQTQTQMRLWSSRAVQRFTHVYLYAQTTVNAGDICTWRTTVILITEKPKDPQFEPRAGMKMAQVLKSFLYICGYF